MALHIGHECFLELRLFFQTKTMPPGKVIFLRLQPCWATPHLWFPEGILNFEAALVQGDDKAGTILNTSFVRKLVVYFLEHNDLFPALRVTIL